MDNELKPLTDEQAADFEGKRQSLAVVQTKCGSCGAWYESARLSVGYQETFNCDCGERMSFPVPPLELKTEVTAVPAVDYKDPDARLDTGMKVKEAVERSQRWWQSKGRKMMRRHKDRQSRTMAGVFASEDPNDENGLPSGIVHGRQWDALSRREKLQVVKIWHHFYVRKPDLLGDDSEAVHLIQDRSRIH